MAFTITDSVIKKILESIYLDEDLQGGKALRVSVKPGGCSGFSYDLFWDTEWTQDEIFRTLDNGSHIVVDSESAAKLSQATLTYREGLMDSGFFFDNKGASRSCGCGQSFDG